MTPLLTRIFSGIIFITLFITAILYSKESFIILTTIFGLISLFEFSKMIQLRSFLPYIFLLFFGYIVYTKPENELIWIILGLTLTCSIRLLVYLYSEKRTYPTHNFEKLDVMVRYITFSFLFLLLLPFYKGNYNPQIIIGILTLIWINDSFAYLVGKNFGKRKLFELISPKKTIEGFIGGLISAIISTILVSEYITIFSQIQWIIISVIISIIGTLGDLIESKFKRRANVKDSGNIMPGHGGILDRFDSLLFAVPFVYLYIHYLI